MRPYRTLATRGRREIEKVRGSRFIASAAPVADLDQVRAFLDEVRREFHAARHHGHAWRMGADGSLSRAADDGEPVGSTGRPILERITARGLSDCLVVVTRYFGGTKLGVGGLARAYGAAAEAVLEATAMRTVVPKRTLEIDHDWERTGAVEEVLGRYGLVPRREAGARHAHLLVEVPLDLLEAFERELRERTAGRARVRPAH